MNNKSKYIVECSLIAALYVVLTLVSNFFGLANGIVQIRLSETLTILPIYISSAIPGLFVGCILSNIITGCAFYDVIFGALATLIGALGTRMICNLCVNKLNSNLCNILGSIPPIVSNTLIIPWILSLVYNFEGSILYFTITVFLGEVISAGIGGQFLIKILEPYTKILGWK